MTLRRELIDDLLKDYENLQDILGEGGLLKELTKALIERCLETELDTHLGYPRHGCQGNATGNTRNGHSQKTLKGEQGHVEIEVTSILMKLDRYRGKARSAPVRLSRSCLKGRT